MNKNTLYPPNVSSSVSCKCGWYKSETSKRSYLSLTPFPLLLNTLFRFVNSFQFVTPDLGWDNFFNMRSISIGDLFLTLPPASFLGVLFCFCTSKNRLHFWNIEDFFYFPKITTMMNFVKKGWMKECNHIIYFALRCLL